MPNDNQKPPTDSQQPQTGSLPPVPTDDMPPLVIEETTPPMLNTTDLPIANTQPTVTPDTEEKKVEANQTDSGSAAPSDDIIMAPVVTTQKKKFAGGKVIATILGLFLLVGGLGAGIVLVDQNQNIEEKAGSCSPGCGPGYQCDGGGLCIPRNGNGPAIAPGTNPYTWNDWQDDQQAPTGGSGAANQGSGICSCMNSNGVNAGYGSCSGSSCDCGSNQVKNNFCNTSGGVPAGATQADINERCLFLSGQSAGSTCGTRGTACSAEFASDCSNWNQPEGTPPSTNSITAQCQNVKAYDEAWTLLTGIQLSQLGVGDSVNFCVTGSATGGSFNKARFTINGALQAETTTVRPSSTDFCQSYVIPAAVTSFNVSAQINHVTLGWK